MTKFDVVIGIEIHMELNTKTKMFSSAPNVFNAEPNTLASAVDLGYPGTMPVLNKAAVEKAIKLAKALNMKIDDEIHFDRKNYFYPDLPKGFQITQHARPIARNGFIPVLDKKVAIAFFHLEEDTAKTINEKDKILLDYNRAGVPLIEVVTEPVIESAKEAVEYISAVRSLVLALDISDAKLEEGSLRADINISLRPEGQKEFGTKVEIKNLNSLGNVEKSIADEIKKQTEALLKGEKILEATKRFDESKQETVIMRVKTTEADYKFFPEPNIVPIKLDQEWVKSIKLPELPWARRERYLAGGIENEYVEKLMADFTKADFFDKLKYENKNQLAKIFFAEVVQIANAQNKSVDKLGIKPEAIDKVLGRLNEGSISGKHVKELIPLLVNSPKDVDEIISERNMKQISDVKTLETIISKIIMGNQYFILQNKDRPERIFKNLLGQLMKETGGQANPVLANEIFKRLLEL